MTFLKKGTEFYSGTLSIKEVNKKLYILVLGSIHPVNQLGETNPRLILVENALFL